MRSFLYLVMSSLDVFFSAFFSVFEALLFVGFRTFCSVSELFKRVLSLSVSLLFLSELALHLYGEKPSWLPDRVNESLLSHYFLLAFFGYVAVVVFEGLVTYSPPDGGFCEITFFRDWLKRWVEKKS